MNQTNTPQTMDVQQVVPESRRLSLPLMLDLLLAAPAARPFASERIAFVADLSRALARRGRGLPETQALAFWMRRAELSRLADDVAAPTGPTGVLLMPRGTVFHVPPANVDTLFVYSLVLSLLAGNRNIVRLSSRATAQSHLILETLADVLADYPQVAAATVMLNYGHDDAVTAAISARCDTRVIWGGDGAVEAIRRVPLPVHATELTFPDRFSLAAIGTRAYSGLNPSGRDDLAERFFNDAYWFDQLGCSSPRLLAWVGEGADEELTSDFHARVRAVIGRKKYGVDTSAAIAKIGQSMRSMIDDQVTAYHMYDNTLTVIDVAEFPQARGEFCGAGFFFQMHVAELEELVPHVQRKDQTLSHFGLSFAELEAFAVALCGRGIDRIVPMGQALAFDRIWDGYDILGEMMRRVVLRV